MTPVTWYDYERPHKEIFIVIITWKAAINGGIGTKRCRRPWISCVILTQGNWIWYWASKGFRRKRNSPNFTHTSYSTCLLLRFSSYKIIISQLEIRKAKLPEQTCEYVSWIVQANSQILGRCNSWECLGQTNLGPVNASPSEGSNSDKNIFHCMLSALWYLIRFVWSHLVCCIQSGLLHLIWIVGSYPDCCILSSLLYLIWIAVSYPDCWMLSE